ncbi:uncharacterized protein LOC108939114 [Scleropages formosus]|uniref:uncharacterized protein LOC108939114 n=1 Tax=Scleropages formosus TaxID=113540 RepID=UPI0010FA8C30|nr:uncharacterized protein LOC108939114 [Scleropages formosus]
MTWLWMAFVALYCSLICECAADVEKRAVKLGDNVTLHCSCIHSEETLWFGQQSDQTPFLIVSVKSWRNGSFAVKNFFQSYIAEFNKENNSISLNILNIRASDLGLFYCLTTSGSMKYIGHGHLLYRERSSSTTTVVQPSPPSPPPPERTKEKCWVLLAAVCPVCVLVTAVPLTACLCWLCYRRNGETCSPVKPEFRCRERGQQERSKDRVQEEDDGLHYATLDIPAKGKRTKTSPNLVI